MTKIESRKCLPLMYQLAARLGTKSHDNPLFQATLNEVCSLLCISTSLPYFVTPAFKCDTANTNLNKGVFIKTIMDVESVSSLILPGFVSLHRLQNSLPGSLWRIFAALEGFPFSRMMEREETAFC